MCGLNLSQLKSTAYPQTASQTHADRQNLFPGSYGKFSYGVMDVFETELLISMTILSNYIQLNKALFCGHL